MKLIDEEIKALRSTKGVIRGLDTSTFSPGDRLYLDPAITGALTKVKPPGVDEDSYIVEFKLIPNETN